MNRQELEKLSQGLEVKFTKETSDEMLQVLVENAQLKTLNQDVNSQLSSKEKQLDSKSKLPVITVDDTEYHVTAARFMVDKKIYTAEQLADDKKLQAKLIKMGSEILLSAEVVAQRAKAREAKVTSTQAFMNQEKEEAKKEA